MKDLEKALDLSDDSDEEFYISPERRREIDEILKNTPLNHKTRPFREFMDELMKKICRINNNK